MKHRTIRQVMTTDVASVDRNMPFKDIVILLATRGISAAPVVDGANRVIGVVSEADLLPKESEHRPGARSRLWHRRLRHKAAATRAVDLMTAPPITVGPDMDVTQTAAVMAKHGVKRLPVVDEHGTLVGIVSRRDLLSVFLRPGHEIADEIREDVLHGALWVDPASVTVDVIDGVAILRGKLERKSMIPIAIELIRRVDGVVDVISHLEFDFDDTRVRPTEPTNVGVLHDLWSRH